MNDREALERRARELYERVGPHGVPAWSQLGDVTRSVWLERAGAAPNQTKPATKTPRTRKKSTP
jgi:hypothetical protein